MSYHDQSQSSTLSLLHELLNDSKLPSLSSNLPSPLFPLTEAVPDSLTYNLVSDHRVLKLIKTSPDPLGNILRGFYYQLLKLCFEMEDHEHSKNYLQIMKSIVFDRSIAQVAGNEIHYRHLGEFLNLMEEEDAEGFEEVIAKYHEVDEALIAILQQLPQERSSMEEGENEVEAVLTDLCELFEITLITNDPYYHFQESGVYLYIQNEERCYIIFNEEGEEQEQQGEQDDGSESIGSGHLKSNIRSEISVSSGSKNPSQLTENNLKNDGNFTKEYTFQPEFRGEHEVFQTSNKNSEISSSINSKECSSRPVSNISYKSHLSNESEYKRQQIGNRYEMKAETKPIDIPVKGQHLDVPENQPPYSHDPFKKGTYKISNPYEISSPVTQSKQQIPIAEKYGSHYFSPAPSPSPTNEPVKEKPATLGESHYVNSSLSSYYDGYYGQIPHNNSMQSSSKNDTIMNLFGEMLKSGKYEGSYSEENIPKPTKRHLQHTEKILETQEEFQKQDSSDLYPNFIKKINKLDTIDMMDRAKSVNSVNQHGSDFNSNSINGSKTLEYSVAEKPEGYGHYQQRKIYSAIQEKTNLYVQSTTSNIQTKPYQKPPSYEQDEGIFYKPKKSQLKAISEVTASKESIQLPRNTQADDSKGSIYRQFSDTRILKLLKEPHKTKVQIMRNRFKGQHFNL